MRRFLACLLAICFALIGLCAAADETTPAGEPASPTAEPTAAPTAEPTSEPTAEPTPEPTAEPTANPTAEPTTEPTVVPTEIPETPEAENRQVLLQIDSRNRYEGMRRSYAEGYVPTIEDGAAVVVLPLLADGALEKNTLRARAELGDPSMGPFQTKNYEKDVTLATHKVNDGKKTSSAYRVEFRLALRAGRMNGSYPVTVQITARDSLGMPVSQTFTVYVEITDGKDPDETEAPEPVPTPEPAVLTPKVLVQSTEAVSLEADRAPGELRAGDRVRVQVTLKNTSRTESLENMAVSAGSPGEGFVLTSASDSVYVGSLGAGETVSLPYEYTVTPETPAGQYSIPLTFDFAYGDGMTGSGTGTARVLVTQPLEMEFALLQMPEEAVVSDSLEVSVQAINLSRAKAYNVRAELEADGLLPGSVAFIGDLEGGVSAQAATEVRVTALTEGNFSYGATEGTLTCLYEDGDGAEHSEVLPFHLNIQSPFSDAPQQAADQPFQWWIVMAGVGAAAAVLGGVLIIAAVRRRRR